MTFPIFDLHCDLLLFLQADPQRTPLDPLSRCSYPQQKQGNVHTQVMAIFAFTEPQSSQAATQQGALFTNLLNDYPNLYHPYLLPTPYPIQILPAIENASAFSEEDEPLQNALQRLAFLNEKIGPLAYVSLTWNGHNRFGGGTGSPLGLLPDGQVLLHQLAALQIPVDVSHASDHLITDIFNYIDLHHLSLPVIASHSNFRTIRDHPRNLPDELAQEIFKRKGLVGLNLYKKFVDPIDHKKIALHVEHAINLGGLNHLSIGADFFCDHDDEPLTHRLPPGREGFFPQLANASCYPYLLDILGLSQENQKQIAYANATAFFGGRALPSAIPKRWM